MIKAALLVLVCLLNSGKLFAQSSSNMSEKEMFTLIRGEYLGSLKGYGWGAGVDLYSWEKSGKWLLPLTINLEHYNLVDQDNYTDLKATLLILGFRFSNQVRKNIFFNLHGKFPAGQESYRTSAKEVKVFAFGLGASESLSFISGGKNGILISAGVFQQVLLTTDVYKFDLGYSLGVGLKF